MKLDNFEFSFDLLRETLNFCGYENSNVISPIGIYSALSFLYKGSNNNTKKQIKDVLKTKKEPDELFKSVFEYSDNFLSGFSKKSIIRMKNAIFLKNGLTIEEQFLKDVEQVRSMEIFKDLDFFNSESIANKINSFTRDVTEGKIKEIIKSTSIDINTRIILLNAIYSDLKWKFPFDENNTERRNFYITKDCPISIPFMKQKNYFDCKTFDEAFTILKMLYSGGNVFMYFILPSPKNSINDYLKLTNEEIGDMLSHLFRAGIPYDKVTVFIPKFEIKSDLNINHILTSLGCVDIFESRCDLTNMISDDQTYVGKIEQSSFIEVQERGTVAASATKTEMLYKGISKQSEFYANRPFAYMIVDESACSILFSGIFTGI